MSKISYCSLEEAWGSSNNTTGQSNIEKKTNEERENVITNMNKVERNKTPENNNIVEYNKYRFNPINKVNPKKYEDEYTPFQESLEKKYLQDKLLFLENEFKKYKYFIEKNENSQENFSNLENNITTTSIQNHSSNDIIDLILLIIIGLIIIFVMNSIFDIGKKIGSRKT